MTKPQNTLPKIKAAFRWEYHARPLSHYLRYEPPPPEPENVLFRYGDYWEEEREFQGRKVTLKLIKTAGNYEVLEKKFSGMSYGNLLRLVDLGDEDAINFYRNDRLYCRTFIDFLAVKIIQYAEGEIESRADFKDYFDMFYQKGQVFYKDRWKSKLESRYNKRINDYDYFDYFYVMNRDIIPPAAYLGWADFEYIYTEMVKQEWINKSRYGGYEKREGEPDKYKIKYIIGSDRPRSLPIRRIGEMDLLDGATADSRESRYKKYIRAEQYEDDYGYGYTLSENKLNSFAAAKNLLYHNEWVAEETSKAIAWERAFEVDGIERRRFEFPDSDWMDEIPDEIINLLEYDHLTPAERKRIERVRKKYQSYPDPRNDIRWKRKKRKYPEFEKPQWVREYERRAAEENLRGIRPPLIEQTPEARKEYWKNYHLAQNHRGQEETCIYCHNSHGWGYDRPEIEGYSLCDPERLFLPGK